MLGSWESLGLDVDDINKNDDVGNSLVVQWLGLHTFTAEGAGSIPGWGTKIPQAVWCGPSNK